MFKIETLSTQLQEENSLQPFLDMIQHVHRYGIDHSNFSVIILEYEYHIEILEVELYSLKVYEFDVFQGDDERRLNTNENKRYKMRIINSILNH